VKKWKRVLAAWPDQTDGQTDTTQRIGQQDPAAENKIGNNY